MSHQSDPTQASAESYAERWAAELFLGEAAEEREPIVHPGYQSYTPFREEQDLEEAYGSQAEEKDDTADLEDEESHEAFHEAMDEASELYEDRPSEEYASALGGQSDLFD